MPFPPCLCEFNSGPGDPFDIQIGVRGIMRLRLPTSNRSPGIAGVHEGFQGKVDRVILFEQLKSRLGERDRSILMCSSQTRPLQKLR